MVAMRALLGTSSITTSNSVFSTGAATTAAGANAAAVTPSRSCRWSTRPRASSRVSPEMASPSSSTLGEAVDVQATAKRPPRPRAAKVTVALGSEEEAVGTFSWEKEAEERAVEAMARGFLGAPRSLLARRWTAEKDGHRGRSSLQLCGFRLTWHHFSLHQPIALHGQDVIWHGYATAKAYASPLLNIQPKLSVCHHSPASRENFCVLYC